MTNKPLCSHMAVISSSFHMPRVQAIFTHCFSLAPSAMSLDFHAVMDDDLFALDTLQARQAKEAESLQVRPGSLLAQLVQMYHAHLLHIRSWQVSQEDSLTLTLNLLLQPDVVLHACLVVLPSQSLRMRLASCPGSCPTQPSTALMCTEAAVAFVLDVFDGGPGPSWCS